MATVAEPIEDVMVEVPPPPTVEGPPDTLYEVIDGRYVEKAMGAHEMRVANRLQRHLDRFVEDHDLGTSDVEMLFLIDRESGLKRRPDVSFVSRERWPVGDPVPQTEAWDVIPDLAVEVVSPSNGAIEMREKVETYFGAGVRLVWLVYPTLGIVDVYESPATVRVLHADDALDGGAVVPGFRLPLSAFLRARARPDA